MSNKAGVGAFDRIIAKAMIQAEDNGQLLPPGLCMVDVEHDDWCEIWNDDACNCESIMVIPDRQ